MAHTLAVASFPDHTITTPHSPILSVETGTAKEKRSHHKKATLMLKPISVGLPSGDAQAYGDDPIVESPYSPIVFSREPGRYVDQVADKSVSFSSASRKFASVPGGAAHPISTKDSIAALGLSRRSPSPKYDLLTTSPVLNPQHGYWDQHIPPRSSSLQSQHLNNPDAMLRSSSSSAVDVDRCSAQMVFAERSPNEAEFGSAAKSPARISHSSWSRHNGYPFRSSLSRAPSSSSSSKSSLSSPSSTRAVEYHNDDMTPYACMAANGMAASGFSFSVLPSSPDPIPKVSAPRKPAKSSPVTTPEPEPQGCSSCSLRLGLRKMKRLAARRSISSFDFFSTHDSQSENRSPSPLSLSMDGQSVESVVSSEIATPPGDEVDEAKERIEVVKVIGEVREPQDLNQVIPALRSLKVSGKFGH
jgi:hypothetical protein